MIMNKILYVIVWRVFSTRVTWAGRLHLVLLLQTHASVSNSEGSGKGENIIYPKQQFHQVKMKFSVDVQTESCIFPCSSSVSYEKFGAKAILWDIQVINVKSNLFNNISTSEVNSELSMNDNENLVNISGFNDQINGTKGTLVAKRTSDDEPQKFKQEEKTTEETNYHIKQNAEQRMKTQGSYIEGKENEKSSNLNEENTGNSEPSEEQAEMNKDVEKKEDAKTMIIKTIYEDTKGSFATENNGHKKNDYKNRGSINEENSKIQKHNEYGNGEVCIGQEVNI